MIIMRTKFCTSINSFYSIMGDIKILNNLPGIGHQSGLTILLKQASGSNSALPLPAIVPGTNPSVVASRRSLEGGPKRRPGKLGKRQGAPKASAIHQTVQKYFVLPVHTDGILLALVASDRNPTQISLWGKEKEYLHPFNRKARDTVGSRPTWIQELK